MRALALLLALAAGCTPSLVPVVGEPGPKLADDAAEKKYQETLQRYSAHREVYSQLDTRMFAAATLQTPAFVEARVRRVGAFQAQPATVVEANLQTELTELAPYHELFLGVHVNNPRHEDFDQSDSMWRLALVGGSTEVTPVSVTRIGRSNLNLRSLYPYLDDFWVAYRVRFPKALQDGQPTVPPGTSKVIFRMASALGRADFEFPAQ